MMPEGHSKEESVAENTGAGKTVGSPVVATDDNGDTLTYTLTNADGSTDGNAALFSIDWGTGQILTKEQAGPRRATAQVAIMRDADDAVTPCAFNTRSWCGPRTRRAYPM